MKKLICLSLCLALIGSVSAIVYDETDENDIMIVQADILKSEVGISVPDNVVIGEIAKGYISDRQDIDIKNTGTTDISVIPLLEGVDGNNSESIFGYLSFQKTLSDDLKKIGYFEMDIEKPAVVGGTRNEGIYMYLDLTEYDGEISSSLIGHKTNVTFWAVPS